MNFKLVSEYKPTGDQPEAIAQLIDSIRGGSQHNTLLGVTGSGKTFTVANVIQEIDRPTLVLSHNKTLAAQLCSEFRAFFPDSAVEYFVSYYDYYQPEAYIASSDTYIEKDAALERRDALLEHVLRGVGQTAIDVSGVGQTEAVSGVLAVAEHIGSGLVDRHCAGIGCGIGLLLANVKLQGLKFIVRHSIFPLYLYSKYYFYS